MLDDPEHEALLLAAQARGVSVAEWVRQAIVAARRREAGGEVDRKLDAIRSAIRHTGPTGEVERVAADIERSYLSGIGPESGGAGY